MKNNIIPAILAVLFLTFSSVAIADTVGNPATVGELKGPGYGEMDSGKYGRLGVGFETEIIFSKDLDGAIESELSGELYMFKIYYTLVDWIEPYFKVGCVNYEVGWTQAGRNMVIDGDDDIGVGGGANVKIWHLEESKYPIRLDGFGSFFHSKPDVESLQRDGDRVNPLTVTHFEVKQWQAGVVLSTEYKFDTGSSYLFIPYVGLKYSDSDNDFKATWNGTTWTPGPSENKNKVGIVVGTDMVLDEKSSLNFEGRFIDETALTAGVKIVF